VIAIAAEAIEKWWNMLIDLFVPERKAENIF